METLVTVYDFFIMMLIYNHIFINVLILYSMDETYFWHIYDQTEVSKFIAAIQSYQDVLQFNVQVNQVMIMQMLHSLLNEKAISKYTNASSCQEALLHITKTLENHDKLPLLYCITIQY
jgi:hypothetical protein